jgi:hypothetical protein
MAVSIRRMTLGSGCKYLMGSVAQSYWVSQYAAVPMRYYGELGTSPGRFHRPRLRRFGERNRCRTGTQVTEERLFRTLRMVRDPLTGEQLG